MAKAPSFQFYPNDWCHDLEEHPLEIEGAWISICCKLWWSETRGKLKRTIEQWAKVLRVDLNECDRIFNYIETWKIGNIQRDGNGEVTVISRRMLRDEMDRNNNVLRQQRFKDRHRSNDRVTPSVTASSQRSSSSSSINNKNITQLFEQFWKLYPSRNGRKVTKKESLIFFKDNFKTEEEIVLLLKATENYSKMTNEGFAKDPIRFLKKDFWRDWIEKREAGKETW